MSKYRPLGLLPVSDLVGLDRSLRIYISNSFPGDADAAVGSHTSRITVLAIRSETGKALDAMLRSLTIQDFRQSDIIVCVK